MDIKHVLSRNPLEPAYAIASNAAPPSRTQPVSEMTFVDFEGGQVDVWRH